MKVQDYTLPKSVPTEAKEMLDDIRRILNNGGYVPQVISAIPAWAGDDGENVNYVSGADVRSYWYNVTNATWNYGLPISTKYGWDYVEVDTAHSSSVKAVSFGYTFKSTPIVVTSLLGYSATVPTSLAQFSSSMTKVVASSYNATGGSMTLAVYSGDGSNFPALGGGETTYYMGVGWLAIG